MKQLFENWRKFGEEVLKEVEQKDWTAAKDADSPLKNFENYDIDELPIHQYLVVFRSNDVYELTADNTHAGMSHAIKHLREMTPDGEGDMNEALNIAADKILDMADEKVFIYRLGKARTRKGKVKVLVPKGIYLDGQNAKDFIIDHTDIIQNTFDFINDKYRKRLILNNEEIQLLPIIEEITNKYYELIENHKGSSIEITDDMSVEQVVEILNNKSIIKFKARFGSSGVSREYIFDTDGGKLFSTDERGKIKTFFIVGADRGTPRTLHTYFCYLHAGVLGPLKICGEGDKKLNRKLTPGKMVLQQQNLIQAFERTTGLSIKSLEEPEPESAAPVMLPEEYVSIFDPMWFDMETKELAKYIVVHIEALSAELTKVLVMVLSKMVEYIAHTLLAWLGVPAEARAALVTVIKENLDDIAKYIVDYLSKPANIELLLRFIRVIQEDVEENIKEFILSLTKKLLNEPTGGLTWFLRTKLARAIGNIDPGSSEEDIKRSKEWAQKHARETPINESKRPKYKIKGMIK